MDSNLTVLRPPRFIRTLRNTSKTQMHRTFILSKPKPDQSRPETATHYQRSNTIQTRSLSITPLPPHSAVTSTPKSKIENYLIGKHLGQGAYATVRLGTQKKTKELFAIKTYEKYKLTDTRKKSGVKREIQILRKLNHPNTIKLFEVLDSAKSLDLVMEFISGLSLHAYLKKQALKRLEEIEAQKIFRQIVLAIKHCHDLNIVHRDIKLENVMIDSNSNVKVIDFGFSTVSSKSQAGKLFCGTPSYMAPEIVKNLDYVGQYADIWALGILLFAMLCGTMPFKGVNDRELFKNIGACKIHIPDHVGVAAQSVIKKILKVNPLERIDCAQILSDKWLAV